MAGMLSGERMGDKLMRVALVETEHGAIVRGAEAGNFCQERLQMFENGIVRWGGQLETRPAK